MAIKSNVEKLPLDKQSKMRANLIQDYELNKPDQEAIEILLDQARLLINEENRSKEDDEKLLQRYYKLTGVLSEKEILDRLEKLIDKPLPLRLQQRRDELKRSEFKRSEFKPKGGRYTKKTFRKRNGNVKNKSLKISQKKKQASQKKKQASQKRALHKKSLKNMDFYKNLQHKRSMAVTYA